MSERANVCVYVWVRWASADAMTKVIHTDFSAYYRHHHSIRPENIMETTKKKNNIITPDSYQPNNLIKKQHIYSLLSIFRYFHIIFLSMKTTSNVLKFINRKNKHLFIFKWKCSHRFLFRTNFNFDYRRNRLEFLSFFPSSQSKCAFLFHQSHLW